MFYQYALLVVFLLNILLGIIVLLRDYKNPINISFSLFVFGTVGWLVINYLSNQFTDYPRAFLYNKLIFLETPYMGFALVYFAIVFPYQLIEVKLKHIILLLAPVIFSNILTYFNLTISGITFLPTGGTGVVFGPGIFFYGAQLVAYLVVSLYLLSKKYFSTKGHQKLQMQYVLLGIIILSIFGTLTNFIIPLLYNNFIASDYGPLLSLFVFGFTAYAILKHNLLNIKVIGTEAVVVLLIIILFAKIFVYQSSGELVLDIIVLGLIIIFGIILIRSVIAEVQQREKLAVLNDKLEEADDQKDEFISIASHDLRSPLSIVKNNLWFAVNAKGIPKKIKENIDVAAASNEHAINLVNDMLDVSRIEMGRIKVDIQKFDLTPVAHELYEDFSIQAKDKKIKLIYDGPETGKSLMVSADKERVIQIFSNLISNALKFTPENGQITIEIKKNGAFAENSVIDTGIGIEESNIPKLFAKFVRLDTSKSAVPSVPGTGLGLYISKKIVTMFGGRIWVESKFGKGSTFTFTMPLA